MIYKYKYKKHQNHNTFSSIMAFENQRHSTLVCACDSPFAVSLLVSFMGQLYFMRVCVSVTSIFAWVCAYVPLSVLCVFFNSDAFLGICIFLTYSLLFLCLKVRGVWPGCVLVFLFMQWALCAHLSSETVRKSLALRLPGQPQCNLQCAEEFHILDFVAWDLFALM